MAKRKVQLEIAWTHAAEIQFQSILEYWLERNQSPTYSQKLAETI